MRLFIVTLCCGFIFMGCKHPQREASSPAGSEKRKAAGTSARASSPQTPATTPSRNPLITPVNGSTGKVVAVNSNLRFVVVDFFLSKLPPLEQRLSVYRQGQKVGDVKISGPERSHNIVADIMAGEAKVGDEVRSD